MVAGSIEEAPTVIVTETPFGGKYSEYYAWADDEDKVAIVTIAHWQRRFAPPSVLEFLLTCIQRYSLRMAYPQAVGSHYPTRACIWDFNANLEDVRPGILVGYLCSACTEGLSQVTSASELDAIKRFIKNDWIGRTEDHGTVASNLKRIYGYDLDRTRGLSPSFRDQLVQALTSEAAKWIVPFVLGALVSWFVAKYGQKGVRDRHPLNFLSSKPAGELVLAANQGCATEADGGPSRIGGVQISASLPLGLWPTLAMSLPIMQTNLHSVGGAFLVRCPGNCPVGQVFVPDGRFTPQMAWGGIHDRPKRSGGQGAKIMDRQIFSLAFFSGNSFLSQMRHFDGTLP